MVEIVCKCIVMTWASAMISVTPNPTNENKNLQMSTLIDMAFLTILYRDLCTNASNVFKLYAVLSAF
jgi:hypothetical protein